ncbi:ergosterol biosynthesis protein [Penicillium lagena]|uniref:ergosterol biosynthesis protein n=1 Tax=Penicillium lagena TaxID=94218 RepID=UPI00254080CD|nr:ergosterol biosynthesis protein [Penicillium lagena]KAJ5604567.1 ergosterol biosynthesis protein [Penicillium lagena]
MSSLLSYLPPFEGLLPKWLFLVSVISAVNSLQAIRSPDYTAQLYNGQVNGQSPVNPLASRLFGTWTLLSAAVRLTAAYHITTPAVYDLAASTFGIALVHFVSEWLAFGSAGLRGRFVSPLIVASSTLAWMVTQRGEYLGL